MQRTQKILSVILAIIMALSIIPITSSAATYSGTCGENVTWEFDESTGTLTFSGTGAMNNIYNHYFTVPWISHQDYIENVVVNNGIYTIVNYAFYDCNNLTSVTLSDTLTSIGYHAFEYCDSLTSIAIPDSVIEICDYAFYGCVNLKDVYYSGTKEQWKKVSIGLDNDELLVANIHYNSTGAAHTHEYESVVTVPDCTEGGYITYTCYCGDTYTEVVDKNTEHNYQLVVNTSPDTTECIKTYKCSICGDKYTETVSTVHTEVVIPEFAPTATTTGLTAGIVCSNCGAILVPQQIIPALGTTDDSSVIVSGTCDTNLTWTYNTETFTLTISGTGRMKNYTSTEARPWKSYLSEIKSIIINDGVTHLGSNAFRNCSSLMYVSIPDSVTSMGGYVFYNCDALTSVILPDSVDTVGVNSFQQCGGLIDVTISNSVTTIGDYAFSGCTSLIKATIPDSVYYVYDAAFAGCTNLKSVKIGKNVTSICNYVFNGCTALTDVYYVGTEEQWNKIMIGTYNTPLENATIHYNSTVNSGDAEHNHNFEIVRVEPTCTEPGYTTYTCECGETYTIKYDAFGHKYNKEIATVEPTCTEPGYTTYICECGETYAFKYDALGHSEEEIPLVLPTTESVGYTRGKKCTTCKQTIVEPVVVPVISETARAGDAGGCIIWTYDEATKTMEFFGKNGFKYYDAIQDSSADWDERPWVINGLSSVQYVIVHEGITGINEESFYRFTGLKTISLPSSLEWICDDAFYGCSDFYIKYNGTKEEWNKIDGHYENYDRIIFSDYSGVTASGTHGDNLTWTYDALNFTLTISGTGAMENVGYNEYPWYEFHSEILNIIIEEGVTTIGDGAFHENGFKNITIPDTVTTIGDGAFYNCSNFKSITIPSSVTKIGNMAFFNFNPHNIFVDDVYYLGTEEMWNNISVGQLGTYSFTYATMHFLKYEGICGDNLTWTFDESTSTLTISGTGAMYEYETDFGGYNYRPWEDIANEIEHIVIGDGVTSISDYAFLSCEALESVTLGSGITKIGDYAFYYCSALTDITFHYSLTEIGFVAFCGCQSLTSVIIPSSVQIINDGAFRNCTKLEDVYYEGTQEQWLEIIPRQESFSGATIHFLGYTGICGDNLRWTFDESTGTLTISGTGEMYDYVNGEECPWHVYADDITKIVISNGVTTIGRYTFFCCENLTSVTIPDSVTTIGYGAFLLCTSLTSIVIPDSVTTIGEGAFAGCYSLANVTIPESVTTICNEAFLLCWSIKEVYYSGFESQWNKISIGTSNQYLTGATIHYNSTGPCAHNYKSVVTSPTCTEQGYTTYTCECGDSYTDNYVDALGHSYTSEITTPATHTTTGVETFTCDCGDTYTETIDKLAEHNYELVVTTPTCTEQGYTTYTCECGDSYTDNYVASLGHTPADAVEENYVASTCTETGSVDKVTYCSVCDEEISRETVTIEVTGHADTDNDGYCDECDEQLCDHDCHSDNFFRTLFWKIINFFNRLFGLNKYCECGIAHY